MAETQKGPGQGAPPSSGFDESTVQAIVAELASLGVELRNPARGLWYAICPLDHQYATSWKVGEENCQSPDPHDFAAIINAFHDQRSKPPAIEALDWSEFLTSDLGAVDWHAGQLIERGQQMSLIGAGKVGKSLLTLEWAIAMAAGYSFLGDQEREPVPVLYLDQENSRRDLQRRIRALGYQADELKNLTYLSFPAIGPLDTRDGASALIARVDHYKPQVVILDTVSRFISKPENDANTWLDLYNTSLKALKGRGITVIRLDHFGKDADRGGRGSSAKTQDVDHVWELTDQGGNTLRLRRTYTRSGLGPDDLALIRHGAPGEDGTTRHEARTDGPKPFAGVVAQEIAKRLDLAGVPLSHGRDRLKREGRNLGIEERGNEVWADVAKIRKAPGYLPWTAENLPQAGQAGPADKPA